MYSNGDKPTHCPLVISRNAAFPRGINGTARPLRRSGAAAAPSEAAASGSRSATKTPNAVWAEVLRHPTNISEDELLSYTHTRALLQLPYARPVPWGSVQSPPFTIKSKNSLYALMVTMVGVRKKEPCKHCSQSRCRFKGCYVLPRQSDPHSVLSGLSACSNCIYKYNAISTCVGRSADSKSANSSRFSSASKEASANRSHLSAAVGKTALKRPRPWSEESEREGSSPMPKRHKTNGLSLGSSESPTGSAVRLNAHRQARAAAEAKGYRLKAPAPGRRPSIASLARKTSATACQTAARSPVSASAATSSAASSSSPKAAPQPPPLPALPPATPTNESLATALAATTISARASTAAADWELAPGHVYESRDGDQGDGGRDVALSWPYLRACGASSASGLAVRPGLRELVVLVLPGTVHEFPVEPLPLIDEDDDGSRGGRGVVRRVSVALSAVKVWLAPADRRGGGRSSREEDDDIDLATAETSNEKEEEDSVGRGKEKQALPSLSVQSPFFLGAGGVVYIDPGVRCRVECRQYEPALLNVLIIDQGL